MTIPAIWPGTDLDSIIFSDEEHGERCGFLRCRAEALYEGIYEPLGACPHVRWPYCLAHKDKILEVARADGPVFGCRLCDARAALHLVRMESLR